MLSLAGFDLTTKDPCASDYCSFPSMGQVVAKWTSNEYYIIYILPVSLFSMLLPQFPALQGLYIYYYKINRISGADVSCKTRICLTVP